MPAPGHIPVMLQSDQLDHTSEPHTVAGSASDTTYPTSENLTLKHALRLPSFEALGIANPHPDRPRLNDITPAYACSVSPAGRKHLPILGRVAGQPANISHAHSLLPLPTQLVSTLTPPSEVHDILWSHTSSSIDHAISYDAAGLMPGHEYDRNQDNSVITPHLTPGAGDDSLPDDSRHDSNWLNDAIESLLTEHKPAAPNDQTFKVLSHALPCPSTDGHVFSRVMSALYEHSITRSTAWINVFHALPGRFSLNDLPRSPPATPGQPLQSEDYFTQKVFDSAVTIADYHTDLSLLPRTPRPAVPPGSIDVAVVERYIPPTSLLEFTTMFDTDAPSILVDRLVELSPDCGTLLFIYPTRTGAETFANEYLSPILEPLLRTLATVHSLPMDFCSALGKLPVTHQLLDHQEASARLHDLCDRLSHSSTQQATTGPRRSGYQVVHASVGSVRPPRQIWAAEWWAKQEKERLREEVSRWTQDARNKKKIDHLTVDRPASAEILRQLMDGITNRPYRSGQEPTTGIEVNVFVIKRT